jgi:ATP-GRASP peptide maturase of grasp-with-spasm system
MILILKSNELDPTSEMIYLWCRRKSISAKIVNVNTLFKTSKFNISINQSRSSCSLAGVELENCNAIILRKWLKYDELLSKEILGLKIDVKNMLKLTSHLKFELKKISDFLAKTFSDCDIKEVPSLNKAYTNKIENLYLAKSYGLSIPSTLISTSSSEINQFQMKHKRIITKPIYEVPTFIIDDNVFHFKYDLLKNDISESTIFPSLIQEYIEKEYEIRSFYLAGVFYSMAIFSQNDQKTKIDFRNYNDKIPNRKVPYILPKIIERKLRKVFKKLELNTGSVDIIKGLDGQYYFLEINPVGQFGMVSFPCNYFLEEKIVNYAIQ